MTKLVVHFVRILLDLKAIDFQNLFKSVLPDLDVNDYIHKQT